ncbi:MAG TPA: 23S rRNA (guanosine(2251)-2'-O)-methyltransferase RlmB [Actinomycetota bacterium]|nr:23S rRNA (guanosine(2251)-2'-O)-methyltransferase RlmB [Actinomycetota bacterium]
MRSEVVAGKRAVMEAVRAGGADEVLVARGTKRSPAMRDVVNAARTASVPVREVARDELDALDADHRGVVARLIRPTPTLGERDLTSREWAPDAIVVVLDGVEDPQNLGAAARSIEAAGAAMLITRTHRSAPPTAAAVRASAGALLHLPHARVANLPRALDRLQDAGFTTVGLDERADRSIFDEPCPDGRVALVVGSEGTGISRLVREHCDLLVSVPMHGKVGSLNAAASLAVVLYAYVLASRGRSAG